MSPPKAFTLVELIVVMTVIALLSAVAMIDYGTSVKKARLQVATEELILLLEDGGVRARTNPNGEAQCWVLEVPVGSSPVLWTALWDNTNNECDLSTTTMEATEFLDWAKVIISEVTVDPDDSQTPISSILWFVFGPPDGDIELYQGTSWEVVDESVVDIDISYGVTDEEIFNKTVRATTITSSFEIY
ncbi:type II secretion system protein [Candidatus Peregrinibacteria bacterium]|jgi:prepilin-type N-terminal cleavage/methylation domain-containing protein|nr:type II secretion system protein [Candidatus Peregrinibacteria bacterium]MBT7483398.1 type II secretion system protein [Candidatus Peregrinibacteria bacterium]MBT7703750.1 type II secretion system protein [Candidatus Peregrinibacteria bacterium]